MSMYDTFATDPKLESESGVVIDYGDFRVTVLRAGGTNKRFQKAVEKASRPLRQVIKADALPYERQLEILQRAFAETVVINWEVRRDGEWVQGIEGPNGDLLPFNRENVLGVFGMLPDLFTDLLEQAQKMALFRVAVNEASSGN